MPSLHFFLWELEKKSKKMWGAAHSPFAKTIPMLLHTLKAWLWKTICQDRDRKAWGSLKIIRRAGKWVYCKGSANHFNLNWREATCDYISRSSFFTIRCDMFKIIGKVYRAIGKRTENMKARLYSLSNDELKRNIDEIQLVLNKLIIKRTAKSRIIDNNDLLVKLSLYKIKRIIYSLSEK